eukprot:scaffold272816_cov18-Tisochrysis_lutea.AAC.1
MQSTLLSIQETSKRERERGRKRGVRVAGNSTQLKSARWICQKIWNQNMERRAGDERDRREEKEERERSGRRRYQEERWGGERGRGER